MNLAIFLVAQAIGSLAEPANVVVRHIGSAVTDRSNIGPLQAGILCVPNGSVRWSDGYTAGLDRVVRATLADTGVNVKGALEERFGLAEPSGDYYVVATITEIRVNICYTQPGFGLSRFGIDTSNPNAIKASGSMSVEWAVYNSATHTETKRTTSFAISERQKIRTGLHGFVDLLMAGNSHALGEAALFQAPRPSATAIQPPR